MSVVEPAGPMEPAANRFTPDAQEWMARIRALSAAFPDEADPKPLTAAEVRLARSTSAAGLETAAVFVEMTPGVVGDAVSSSVELRDAIAFELAYSGVRDEARSFVRRIDMAILRRKLKAARAARWVYKAAKGYVALDAGDSARPHVAEMKRTLGRKRRKKNETESQREVTK